MNEVLYQEVSSPVIGIGSMGDTIFGSDQLLGFSIPNVAPIVSTGYASNTRIAPPDLTELLSFVKYQTKSEMNCISLGTIVSFDSVKQTATVSINFKRVIQGGAPANNNSSEAVDKIMDYPQLLQCPVFVLSGGTGAVHMPITTGDTCIVLFCDRDIDKWFTTGQVLPPNSSRVHDINDGIVLVGVRPVSNSISSFRVSGPALVYGDTVVATEDRVLIQTGSYNLKTALDLLIDEVKTALNDIKTFYTTVNNLVISGTTLDSATQALIAANIVTLNAAITAIDNSKTEVDGLLK